MKIGFFGGTFDPIHHGHLNLAIEILEKKKLDRIFFCPANRSPEKKEAQPVVSAEDRFAMLTLALEPIPAFSPLDWEIKRPGLSYTIDTLRMLKAEYPKAELHLIFGEDILAGLHAWKDVEALLQLAPPLVGLRHFELSSEILLPPALLSLVRAGLTHIPLLDISSTQLRKRLKERKYCGHLVPSKVLDYIVENRLYY